MRSVLRNLLAGILFVAPALGWADCAEGSVHYWSLDGTLKDACGGNPLIRSGEVPFSRMPGTAKNRLWAGPFSQHQFLKDSKGRDVNTRQGSVEFEFDAPVSMKSCVIFAMGAGGESFRWLEAYTYGGTLNIFNANLNRVLNRPYLANTRYHVGINWSPKGTELWMGTSRSNMKRVDHDARALSTPRIEVLSLGLSMDADGAAFDGHLGDFRLSKVPRFAFPTEDPRPEPKLAMVGARPPLPRQTDSPTVTQTVTPSSTPTAVAAGSVTATLTAPPGPSPAQAVSVHSTASPTPAGPARAAAPLAGTAGQEPSNPTPSPTWMEHQDASQSPASSPTPLPKATPTRTAPLGFCPAPFPLVFTPVQTPVLVPGADYEKNCVLEPNVILGPDKLYHMTYSCNAFSKGGLLETIGLATSPDLIHWTRYGDAPIIGNGHGGEDQGAGMSFQIHIGKEWRVYFKGEANAAVDYVTSKDAYHYKYAGTAIYPSQFKDLCGSGQDLDSCGIIYDGGLYWAIAEVMTDSCTAVPGPLAYTLWLFKSTDGAKTFKLASKAPLSTITSTIKKPWLYAGGRATFKVNGTFYTFPHIFLPSSIYLSKSRDLFHWKTCPVPVVTPGDSGTLLGLSKCNQAADASVIQAKGRTYLFYDGTDNFNASGRIGVTVFPGTEADLDACLRPKPE
jgi:hypothetical protein